MPRLSFTTMIFVLPLASLSLQTHCTLRLGGVLTASGGMLRFHEIEVSLGSGDLGGGITTLVSYEKPLRSYAPPTSLLQSVIAESAVLFYRAWFPIYPTTETSGGMFGG